MKEGRQRIYSLLGKVNDEHRMQLMQLLALSGYAVRIGKEMAGKKMVYFVEYWEEKEGA